MDYIAFDRRNHCGHLGVSLFCSNYPDRGKSEKTKLQGVVKHDWLPTGRIDFTTTSFEDVGEIKSKDKPGEFKLLVEERRIVESLAGNENLEIQWRVLR
jgi:hypothetical protein